MVRCRQTPALNDSLQQQHDMTHRCSSRSQFHHPHLPQHRQIVQQLVRIILLLSIVRVANASSPSLTLSKSQHFARQRHIIATTNLHSLTSQQSRKSIKPNTVNMFKTNAAIHAAASATDDDNSSVTSVTSGSSVSSTTSSSWDASEASADQQQHDQSHTVSTASDAPAYLSTPLVEPHTAHKKVLVTGGAGFIGSHVADHLLARGDDVVIVDEINDYYDTKIKESNLFLLLDKYGPDRVIICRGDICDEAFIADVFESHRPQWVCHLAARAGVRPSIQDPFVYIHSNIKGTTRLMELSHRYGIQNFVFASSSSVYGGSKSTFFSEEENVDNPVSPYAASKKACELLAYTYHHLYNLNVSGLRFFTVYGPRGRPDMAPFKFIDRVSRGVELQKFGDGSSSRDYTYIDDIVDGVIRAIDRPYPYQIFNLGKGSGTSLNEFIAIVEKHVGKTANVRQLPDQPGDVPYTCADTGKARHLLGYRAKVSFDEGIRRTCKWYQGAFDNVEDVVCPETQANGLGRAASCIELAQPASEACK